MNSYTIYAKPFRLAVLATVLLQAAASGNPETGWAGKNFGEVPSPVNPNAVTVEGKTEIKWMPEPFKFTPGSSLRYVDFENGDDTNSGTSKEQPWKHHPWDQRAGGNAAAEKGVLTYVFKGGVVYRGNLVAGESGTAAEPIRLTRDPSWGEGIATLSGAELITGGWQKVSSDEAAAVKLPESSHGKVWVKTLEGDFVPRAAWVLAADGSRERVNLARWPNWKIEHEYNHFTQWHRVEKIQKGFPKTAIFAPKVLNDPDPKAFEGATVWMEHPNASGDFSVTGIFPSAALGYDPKRGMLRIPCEHPNRHPQPNSPFYLENLPRFLDTDGEWTFVPKDRKLYLRLPGDADPNGIKFEVAAYPVILDIVDKRHIEVTGLRFTGGNAFDYNGAARAGDWERPSNFTLMGAIRIAGDSRHLTFGNLDIRDTAGLGITTRIDSDTDVLEDIQIADSEFENLDNDGIYFNSIIADLNSPHGEITDIRVFRNRLQNIGLRCSVSQGGKGIHFQGLKVGEIAGNVINTTGAQGINVFAGRSSHTPLVRVKIHGNQVSEGLLQKADFGNIEFWGDGTAYVYNNISFDPVGFIASRKRHEKAEAFYFDHGAKGFLFNNIGWSKNLPEPSGEIMATTFFKEVRNRWNQAFHNTAYNFRQMQNMEGKHGDQQHYLANVFIQNYPKANFLSHWGLDDAAELGYARNILAGEHGAIYSRWRGARYETIGQFQSHIESLNNHITPDEPAFFTDDMPVIDPEDRDFRLSDSSAAIDRGVRVFVPWALYGNVGEWFFRYHPRDPNTVLPYDLYPQEMYDSYQIGGNIPGNELVGEGFVADDYRKGALEDWNRGALGFDGKKFMRIPQERLVQNIKKMKSKEETLVPGTERRTVRMTDNNFLIEAVLRTEAGGGIIAGKQNTQAGYSLALNDRGHPVLTLKWDGQATLITGKTAINDGKCHHLIAEVDRSARKVVLYLNGEETTGQTSGEIPESSASLDNSADFEVGRGFNGELDYLRVVRGTLADAKTDIKELMAWQFNGPQFHDFVGRAPTGKGRDAGALEHPVGPGIQVINYKERAPREADVAAAPKADEFQTGGGRGLKEEDWGSVSFPKVVRKGGEAVIQVVFGVESIERTGVKLRVDLHGFKGQQRIGTIGHSQPVNLTPGVTTPYNVKLKIADREGLTRVSAVMYISPDGTYANRVSGTEVGMEIGEAPATAPEPAPVKGAVEWKEGPGRITGEYDWGRVSMPEKVKAGEEMDILVDIKPGIIPNAQVLQVDLHWWQGADRKGPLTRAQRVQVSSNTKGVQVARATIPEKNGITRLAAIIYVAPDAQWSRKIFSAELGGVTVE